MWIVKIGGSLAGDPSLRHWLSMLSMHGAQVAIVPGGGPFAEQVRKAQAAWRFDDRVAHNLAVLAMAQFGMLMQGMCELLVPVQSASGVAEAARNRRVPIWLPFDMLRSRPDALTTWDATSDTLAAWLADRIGAQRLVLVKSCALPQDASPDACAEAGIVDRCFPMFVREAAYAVSILHRSEWGRVECALRDPYPYAGADPAPSAS
ncbi:MAG TPA: hypothetical protein VI258_15210 [Rhodanobacteraceae bacterium]